MVVLSVWNEKGGVGKTTISLMLAGAAAFEGAKTMLLDCDPQASAAALAVDGNFPFEIEQVSLDKYSLQEVINQCEGDYDVLVIDMPPNTNTYPVGVVILPYQPTLLAYQVGARHVEDLNKHCEKVIEVASMVDLRKREHRQHIADGNTMVIKNRSVYERVTNQGTTIFNQECQNWSGCREAKKEIMAILNEVIA